MTVEAVITRCTCPNGTGAILHPGAPCPNGRVINLGAVSLWHRNPLLRWAFAAREWFRVNLNLRPDLKGN